MLVSSQANFTAWKLESPKTTTSLREKSSRAEPAKVRPDSDLYPIQIEVEHI